MNIPSEKRVQFSSIDYLQPDEEIKNAINEFFPNRDFKNLSVLDAGCRLGEYKRVFDEMGAHTIGVDFNKSCIENCKIKFPSNSEDYILSDISNLYMLKDSSFDLIFCIGVMPYLSKEKIDICLKEFQRVLNKKGQILIMFQKKQTKIILAVTKIISLVPFKIYSFFFISLFGYLLYPLAKFILGKKVTWEYFKYGVLVSSKNVNYGYPNYLEKYKIPTPKNGPFSVMRNESFIIKKDTPIGKKSTKGNDD